MLLLPAIERCESKPPRRAGNFICAWRWIIHRAEAIVRGRQETQERPCHPGRLSEGPGRPGCRPADPHRRRTAPQRFPALGMRLCRTGFHARDVAGLSGFGSGRGRGGIPFARAAIWSGSESRVGVVGGRSHECERSTQEFIQQMLLRGDDADLRAEVQRAQLWIPTRAKRTGRRASRASICAGRQGLGGGSGHHQILRPRQSGHSDGEDRGSDPRQAGVEA